MALIDTSEDVRQAAPPNGDMIVVEDLWRTYDMGSEQQVQALRGVSLRIKHNDSSSRPSTCWRAPPPCTTSSCR